MFHDDAYFEFWMSLIIWKLYRNNLIDGTDTGSLTVEH